MGSLYPNVARITLESDALQAWFAASRSRCGKMSLLVALVGLRGAGKRLLEQILANEWDYEFVEIDKGLCT
jgi:SpoVK/Ycf46/Vps4 family AAA+-type ATPase